MDAQILFDLILVRLYMLRPGKAWKKSLPYLPVKKNITHQGILQDQYLQSLPHLAVCFHALVVKTELSEKKQKNLDFCYYHETTSEPGAPAEVGLLMLNKATLKVNVEFTSAALSTFCSITSQSQQHNSIFMLY